MKKSLGFTLVELLVVISIIAILSVIGMVVYRGIIDRVQNTKLQADFDSMYKNIEQARFAQQKTFMQLTGNGCSECGACRSAINVSIDIDCLNVMTISWSNITTAPLPRDPWNNPYLFDENEWEGSSSNCNTDFIRSVGPDHIWSTSDDIGYYVPHFFCVP